MDKEDKLGLTFWVSVILLAAIPSITSSFTGNCLTDEMIKAAWIYFCVITISCIFLVGISITKPKAHKPAAEGKGVEGVG